MEKSLDVLANFLSPNSGSDEPRISEVEKLMSRFEAHESEEKVFLHNYRAIVEDCKNPMAAFLLNLIITDEERHQAVVHSMAATIKGSLTWTQPPDALRSTVELGEEESAALLRLTEKFIKEEKKGIKEYKKLIKTSRDYYQGLFVLLIKTMIHDSEKHVMILEFLRGKLAVPPQEFEK
jgi:bacterioferritin (cytochrome b1)